MRGRAAPAQREGAIQQLSRARPRPVAHGGKIGNQADVPEQDREQQIADDRPEIPDQRAAPLRPERHRVGIGGQPVGIDRPAQMDDRHDAGDRDREQRHRLRETVDRAAPRLPRQQQHGRDQRAGVADPDPPDVVGDRHAPHDGGVDAPDPDSLVEQPADRSEEPEHERQAGEQGEPPDPAGGLKHRLGDSLGDLDIAGSPGGNPAMRRRQALFEHRAHVPSSSKPGAGLRTSAR